MSTTQLESNDTSNSGLAHDFKLIRGIGPAVEAKLHSAGISTFAQLAEMSPAELASLFPDNKLLSEDRIATQDWIGQARLLTDKYPAGIVVDEEIPLQDGQHYAVFTVELLLDGANAVRRTRIMHVQSHKEITWAGWDEHRLIGYLIGKAEVPSIPLEAVASGSELEMETVQTKGEYGEAYMTTRLRLNRLEAIPSGFDQQTMTFSQDHPVDLHLTLDLSQVGVALSSPINYAVTVYTKSLSNGQLRSIGEAKGSVEKSDEVNVVIKDSLLPAGAHRLEAIAMIAPLSDDARDRPTHMAMLEGQVIKVY